MSSTIAQKHREKKKKLLNLRELRRRRSVKWLDFVNFRKKQPTDRLRLTLLGLREHSRKERDRLARRNAVTWSISKKCSKIWKTPVRDSSWNVKPALPNRLSRSATSSSALFRSKRRSKNKSALLRKRKRRS